MEHDPREFDDYLRGNSDISRAYQRLKPSACPPREVDERLMREAREALAQSLPNAVKDVKSPPPEKPLRPRWHAPFALAASLVLSVALVVAVVSGPMKQRRSAEAPKLVYAAAHKTDRLRLRTEPPAAVTPAAEPAHVLQRRLYSTDPPLSKPERVDSLAQPHDPHSWLLRIRELRRAGRHAEAQAEYQRFRSAFPGYPITDEDAAAH